MKKGNQYRDKRLLDLWLSRPSSQRTENDIMPFYSSIAKDYESLFHGITYDPYQYLMGLLRPYIHDKP